MFALIGLGNPGAEYATTRHNIGFMVLDAVAEVLRVRFRRRWGGLYASAEAAHGGEGILLVKPMTYMNNSGVAVAGMLQEHRLGAGKMVVIADDFHLPLGRLRIRLRGSDGGHNGLRSIAYHLQTDDFARIRCGIGGETMPVQKQDMADYVLASFDEDERERVGDLIGRACEAALGTVAMGFDAVMQRYNRKTN